jgi:glycosyltransferase involved in cell wall biosynthesis
MVTGAYYPEISSGGLQARLMAAAMCGRAVVRILTTSLDLSTPRHSVVDGIDVTRIHLRAVTTRSKMKATGVILPEVLRLVRWCDVVHLHGVSSKNILVTAVARLLRKPVVLSLHTMGADAPEPVKRSGALSWWAFESAARYLAVSPALVQSYLEAGMPADRIEQVGNGIATELFSPASPDEKRELRRALRLDDRPIVLFVGFFSQDKQPRVLFDAWLRLRDVHNIDADLLFVGATKSAYHEVDESLAEDMRADAEARGLADRVTFTGPVQNVHDYLRAADVFVLPSRREGLPVALMEAMACALPSVASRLPGSTDTLIEGGLSGLLVPPGDVAAFAEAVSVILTAPDRAVRMGTAARATVSRHFGVGTIAARWLANYRMALGNQISTGPENSGPPAAG